MKNNKNIIVSIVCVSILFPILLFISFYAVLLPSIIAIYSNILFIIIFIFVPMLLLILLIKSSIKYKNNLKKMIGFNILYFLTYILIILLVRYIIIYRLSVYNYYLWNDYDNLRYLMINSYDRFRKDDLNIIYKELGKPDIKKDNIVCYYISGIERGQEKYCLEFKDNKKVINSYITCYNKDGDINGS